MTVEEIMTENVKTVRDTDSLGEAFELLAELDIRHLPVVRDDEVVGMLSDRDLRALGFNTVNDVESMDELRAALEGPVSNLMSGNVLTVGRSTDVVDVVDLMVTEKVGAVPVVDEGTSNLVGIVSYVDVLKAAREALS